MKLIFRILLPFTIAAMLGACSGSRPSVADELEMARQAFAEGNYHQAQTACNNLLAVISGADSLQVSEQQAGELAIMFMKLSEHQESEENVAEATLCFRYAFRLSADSLQAFSQQLPIDDIRHFELLRRIGLFIDNPVDLTSEEFEHEDSAVIALLHDELNDNL